MSDIVSKIHKALSSTDLEYSAYSCNGVNIFGDRKSIDAAAATWTPDYWWPRSGKPKKGKYRASSNRIHGKPRKGKYRPRNRFKGGQA